MGRKGGWGVEWDAGLEGGLYRSGECGLHLFGGKGLSKRISEKGRCENDPVVDKKREWRQNSIRAPVVKQYSSFFFFLFSE